MTIRVLSFDFDGCLFHKDYLLSKDKDVVFQNQVLLRQLKDKQAAFEQTIVFIGSSRQSKHIDDINSRKGSCFPAIRHLSDYLSASLDPFLLADVYEDLPEGTSYARVMSKDYHGLHGEYWFDPTKITILYAQMHKIALQFPQDKIIFKFYDNRGVTNKLHIVNILNVLKKMFKAYPELMPKNLRLDLRHYAGTETRSIANIQGKGFIDANYRETVKDLSFLIPDLKLNAISSPHSRFKVFSGQTVGLNPGLLKNRIPMTVFYPEPH